MSTQFKASLGYTVMLSQKKSITGAHIIYLYKSFRLKKGNIFGSVCWFIDRSLSSMMNQLLLRPKKKWTLQRTRNVYQSIKWHFIHQISPSSLCCPPVTASSKLLRDHSVAITNLFAKKFQINTMAFQAQPD